MKRKKVLLSTDIGSDVDDALALRVMLEEPIIDLKGIYTVNGDVLSRAMLARHATALHRSVFYRSLDFVEKNSRLNLSYDRRRKLTNFRAKVLPKIASDITVALGDSEPLQSSTRPYSFFENSIVDDVFFYDFNEMDYDRKKRPLKETGINESAVRDIAKKLSTDPYTIFSIGPMTTISRVLKEHPNIRRNIERIIIMGSRFSDNGPEHEHNFRFDSGAAQDVLDSDVTLLVVPADLCSRYRMPVCPLRYKIGGGSVRRYVDMLINAFVGKKTAINFARLSSNGLEGYNRNLLDLFENVRIVKNQKFSLAANMGDPHHATDNPEEYFSQFEDMLKAIEDCNERVIYQSEKKDLVKTLSSAIPRNISIADLYVPYVFLYPDKIKTERRKFRCDFDGRTIRDIGKEHEVVVDLDWKHFDIFVREYFLDGYNKV